jgi:hypothetical protein
MHSSWKTFLLAALLPLSANAVGKDVINVSLPVDTRIEPILLLAQYAAGDCSHPETARKDKRNAGLAHVDRCMGFPYIVAQTLKSQGFDVQLEVFNPADPMPRDAYANAASTWSEGQRAAHPERYVLNYMGQLEGRQSSLMLLSLEAPGTQRALLGRLDMTHFWIDSYGRPVAQARQAEVVANTLDHRCPIHGPQQKCNDRLPLIERAD